MQNRTTKIPDSLLSNKKDWIIRNGRTIHPDPFCLVGILNITPDSFSEGGTFFNKVDAIAHGLALLDDGAGILDLGAESTRPYAEKIDSAEESSRLMPVLAEIRHHRPDAILSVDTYQAETARKAMDLGADVINDISACRFDPSLLDIVAEYKPGYVLMHSLDNPVNMQRNPYYHDVVATVLGFFERHMNKLVKAGLPEQNIVLDPGIGFGKTADHNKSLLGSIKRLQSLGRPLYFGVSRKSLFGTFFNLPPDQRDEATHLTVALLAEKGVLYHRVHDVAGCARALKILEMLREKIKEKPFLTEVRPC